MADITDNTAELPPLKPKEQTFADHYLVALNKSMAAIAAGCPALNARSSGYEIYNRPHVKAYIEAKLKEQTITAEETIKLISDTAQASITDYFVPVKVERCPKIKVNLAVIIADREEYVKREMLFLDRVGYTEKEYDGFVERLSGVKNEILRLKIELERDPSATRIIDGPPELVVEMQLDINALVADKEKGKVKKIKIKDGNIEVEMYSAEEAWDKLMRLHGKYAPIKTALTDPTGEHAVQIIQLPANSRQQPADDITKH